MDSQDIAKMSQKMKKEAEDFINRHMYDQAKGWPVLSRFGTDGRKYRSSSTSDKMEQNICAGKRINVLS